MSGSKFGLLAISAIEELGDLCMSYLWRGDELNNTGVVDSNDKVTLKRAQFKRTGALHQYIGLAPTQSPVSKGFQPRAG